jgi:hypothetical protein
MDGEHSGWRTDQQLEAILYDTCQWAIEGHDGRPLGFAASLRRVLDRESDFAASGAVITALTRRPVDYIVILPDQIARLRKIIAGRETPAIKLNALDDADSELWDAVTPVSPDGGQESATKKFGQTRF